MCTYQITMERKTPKELCLLSLSSLYSPNTIAVFVSSAAFKFQHLVLTFSHSSLTEKWKPKTKAAKHQRLLSLSWLESRFSLVFNLTFSTSLNTRRKFSLKTPFSSVSFHPLLRSSSIREGYLETSSNPSGKLLARVREEHTTHNHYQLQKNIFNFAHSHIWNELTLVPVLPLMI